MSPRLPSGSIAPRLGAALSLLALLAPAAIAQAPPDEPFTSVVDGSSYLGNTPLRIWHRTRGYGEETSETAFGTHWAMPFAGESLGFIDGQFRIGNNDTDFSLNLGAGYRWRADDFFTGDPRILGVSFWYDGEDTGQDNFFNQLGFSLERLGPAVDLRFNANFPLEDPKQGDDFTFTGATTFVGSGIAQATLVDTDVPLRVVDFEVAPRIFNFNAWAYGGGYQMDGEGISETGWKAGGRGYVTNDLALDVGVTDDDQFGTNTVVQVIWTPGRTGPVMSNWPHNIEDRMREQVYRNAYVAVDVVQTAGAVGLTDEDGQAFNVVHVNSNAAPGGDGTVERPFDQLADVQPNSTIGDIILVHANSVFNGENVMVQDSQRLLGEGNNVTHTVTTSELGDVNLPETFAGASMQAKPIIQAAPAPGAIILAGGNDAVENLAAIEISNLQIDGGTSGIVSPTGVGGVNVNRMMINNTTGDGINLTPLVETLANNTTRQRFQPTIDDVMFNGVLGDDIDLTSMVPAVGNAIAETATISDVTSTGGNGVGVNLNTMQRVVNITNYTWDGGATGDGAIRSAGGVSQNNVVASNVTISNGQAGSGFAIDLENSAATHTFTSTTITNTGGDSIIADGSTASMTLTGRITQANNASVLSVVNGHDGTLAFNESTTGQGVIQATNGDGLQFENADGTYNFNHEVELNGGDAGIDVLAGSDAVNGSQGSFTFANADIDFNNAAAAASAIVIDDSNVQAFTLSGDVDVVNGRPVTISNNVGGSMTFNATIDGMDEEIHVEGNSAGTARFVGQVTMATTVNRGVFITNNTGGSTRFDNIDLTTTTGDAFTATNSAGHTVEVASAAGVMNTITTTTGIGLNLNTVAVGAQNVNFASVNVSNAASNGVLLANLTGPGQVLIGSQGTTPGNGGTIAAAGAAVSITNAANVSINNMILSSTGAQGIDYNVTTAPVSRLTVNNNQIANTQLEGLRMNVSGAATEARITITANDIQNTSDDEAVLLETSGATGKTVNLLVQNNETISTDSAAAPAANFQADGTVTLNATVTGNEFEVVGAGVRPLEISAVSGASTVRLDMNGNTGNAAGDDYFLEETVGATFTIQDRATVEARNTPGTFNFTPAAGDFTEEPGTVPLP